MGDAIKLPNANQAVIPPEKVRDYLLSSSHPVGRFKAIFFETLGYTDETWERLEADIRTVLTNEAKIRRKDGIRPKVRGRRQYYRSSSEKRGSRDSLDYT